MEQPRGFSEASPRWVGHAHQGLVGCSCAVTMASGLLTWKTQLLTSSVRVASSHGSLDELASFPGELTSSSESFLAPTHQSAPAVSQNQGSRTYMVLAYQPTVSEKSYQLSILVYG